MPRLFVCQSVSAHAVCRLLSLGLHRSCPALPEGTLRRLSAFFFHRLSGSWERDKATPWWHHWYWSWGGVWSEVRGTQRRQIRIFLSQSDDPYCQVTVLESSQVWGLFSTAARCWDVEGWCAEKELFSYWDRVGLAWFARWPEAFGGQ